MIQRVNYVAGDAIAVLGELDMTFFRVASIKFFATCWGQKGLSSYHLTLLRLKMNESVIKGIQFKLGVI